ncbi:hypothetical protein PM082_024093 [Marasmius tenuissimus]|nr:hypothetical protein PM082_024093 [Marasmius tenuissimus]
MVAELEAKFIAKSVPTDFTAEQHHIWCFVHILHLACTAIIEAANESGLAKNYTNVQREKDKLSKEGIILHVCDIVCQARASGVCRRNWEEILVKLEVAIKQLLCDVNTRWGSVYYMIDRLLELHNCLIDFILDYKYTDIKPLMAPELVLAEQVKEVLGTGTAFQQSLSTDKTPTLCDYLPNIHCVITRWTTQQQLYPHLSDAIQQGINNMKEYQDKISTVDVYSLALILHPNQKMKWFNMHRSFQVNTIKEVFFSTLEEVVLPPDFAKL